MLREHDEGEQRRHRPVVERSGKAPAVAGGEAGRRRGRRCGRSVPCDISRVRNTEHIIGDRVSATMPEMIDRAGQREGEFAEERAGEAGQQADRRIDRGQRDGHGDDRPDDLARADERRLDRRLALLDMAVDVLDHDDRVVDDQADGQHHGQQGQQIEAEARAPA